MSHPHLWEPPDEPENWLSSCACAPADCLHKLRESSASPVPTTAGRDASGRYPGARYAQIIKLREGCEEEYVKMHAAVWPGVQEVIKDCGIQDCAFLFLGL